MRLCLFALGLLGLGFAGCGDDDGLLTCTGSDDPDELRGSYCEGSEISWDAVSFGWFEAARTLRVRYGVLAEDGSVSPRFEIQVLGERVELTPGTRIPLRTAGFVRRWPEGGRDPQNLTDRLDPSSGITFDPLVLEVGGAVGVDFDLLLENGRTLRGEVSGTLEDISPP